jgi:bacitracin transport system ATP-binding protein
MESILKTNNLSKHYRLQKAVNNLNLIVNKGDIYGFLGQNGAGKTTTIRMIMGLIKPTSGEVELFGEKVKQGSYEHFDRIGSIIETPGFYPNLTAPENLEIHRRLMGVANKNSIEEALNITGLEEARNKQVKKFSLGMKQRLGLARALLHQPELLILDEPTNGLDPIGIKEVRQLLLDLAHKRKITIFMSSHLLSEVQQLATKIGIIHKGVLLEEIEYEDLQKKNRQYIEVKVNNDKKATLLLEQQLHIEDYKVMEPGVLRVYEKLNDSGQINKLLSENGIEVSGITLLNDSLEDYFIRLTGGAFDV